MPGTIRHVRGEPNVVDYPKASADSFQAGDVCWWDATNGVLKKASQATGADHAARAGVVGASFAGICVADRDAGDTGPVPVATTGDFLFPSSGTINALAGVRVVDNSGTPSNSTLEATTTTGQMIGRAVNAAAANYVLVRIIGRQNLI